MKTEESIGAFDAKTHLSALLERVAHGESFVIKRRGKPVARLIPADPEARRPATDELIEAARKLREQVQVSSGELRAWIDEGRR
jgi:prevent-host-death family protein